MMEVTADREAIDRIWTQLNAPHSPGRRDGKRTAHLDVLKEGWGASHDIQDILYETDTRADVLVRHNDDFACLLAPYNLHFESRYRGPFAIVKEVWGHRAMRAVDVAMYVMEVERLGFSVNAEPLVSALRPQLIRQKYATNSELSVLWYARQRHRCEPIILRAAVGVPDSSATVITHSGYKATAMMQNGKAVVLRVDAARSRKGFPIKYWVPSQLRRDGVDTNDWQ